MQAINVQPNQANLIQMTHYEPPTPAANEILVRWHATSLNYHDFLVAKGFIPVEAGRIPMSDGAGEVIAVGGAVKKWKEGDL